jgi:hypothetical protein
MNDSYVVARVGGRPVLVLAGASPWLSLPSRQAMRIRYDLTHTSGRPTTPSQGSRSPQPDADGGITLGPQASTRIRRSGRRPSHRWQAFRAAVRLAWSCVVLLAIAGAWHSSSLWIGDATLAAAGHVTFLPLLSELRFGNLNLITLALCLSGRIAATVRSSRILFAVAIGLKRFRSPCSSS